MINIINITEKNNRLEFSDTYAPIVCGNSNYVLKFSFSEQWQNCNKKAAIFIVEGNKLTVDFDGDECAVPVMPNASFMQVSLVSAVGDVELATTAIKIRLEPTVAGGDFSEFNQLTNYLPKVLGAINKIEGGDVIAKNSENSKNAEFATNASYSERANVASVAQNVSNPNLLINGDFRINQRGKDVYNGASAWQYTFDRWRIYNTGNIVDVATKKITLAVGTFEQIVEDYASLIGKTLTFSINIKSYSGPLSLMLADGSGVAASSVQINKTGTISVTRKIQEGSTTLRCIIQNTGSGVAEFEINWAKLEVGSTPTEFIPRLYGEELALCQRFYQIYKFTTNMPLPLGIGRNSSTISVNFLIPKLRTTPSFMTEGTVKILNLPSTVGLKLTHNQYNDGCYRMFANTTNLVEGGGYCLAGNSEGYYALDAEIY